MERRMEGFGLIEVLVSMLILGVGILGMIGLQLNALQFNQTAAFRSHATFLAYDIADRMRANAPAALSGSYSIGLSDSAPTGSGIAETDLREWKAAMATQLPAGNGSVGKNGDIYSITVQWDETKSGGEAAQQFVFTTRLCERDCL
ncbi:type IV pilus modification protein PilV [Stutzerimonas chloritidismutans]